MTVFSDINRNGNGGGGGLKRPASPHAFGPNKFKPFRGFFHARPQGQGPPQQPGSQGPGGAAGTRSLAAQRKALPIFQARSRFLEEARKHPTLILVGETGSGKTTQIPQFIREAGLHLKSSSGCSSSPGDDVHWGRIAVTQPRRVAAITLCQRVSEEVKATSFVPCPAASPSVVGYRVRFEDVSDPRLTEIIFQTDGMLLREAMLDPLLSKYNWIILDEAHERTVHTDILFGVVKAAQAKRNSPSGSAVAPEGLQSSSTDGQRKLPQLKVIVMSATLQADKFSSYFGDVPVLYVMGRQHPVNVRHVVEPQEDWTSALISTIFQIHHDPANNDEEEGDVLVFMTGQDEIEGMAGTIKLLASSVGGPDQVVDRNLQQMSGPADGAKQKRLQVVTLYAAQQSSAQQRVFQPAKPGFRKVILSTNVAETSLTIPGVRFVIDSCRVKAKSHLPSIGLDILKVVKISKAQALQRTGRAGREAEGHCFRVLTRKEFEQLPEETVPEILRCNLCNVVLQMLSMGVSSIAKFDFLEAPPGDAIEGAVRQLLLLGAVEAPAGTVASAEAPQQSVSRQELKLTELGKQMAAFPLDPRFTKAILCAVELGCTEEVITIVALLSGESILVNPSSKRDEALNARKQFVSSEGDHITLLRIFRAFKQSKDQAEFCRSHFINLRHVKFALEIRKQLMDLCARSEVPVQSCGARTTYDPVRRALSKGMFTNVARLTREGHYVTLDSNQKVQIHPSSVMFSHKPEVVLFTELIATQKSYVRDLSLVDSCWLLEDQPEYFRVHRLTNL